jgi:hypothetical protein
MIIAIPDCLYISGRMIAKMIALIITMIIGVVVVLHKLGLRLFHFMVLHSSS